LEFSVADNAGHAVAHPLPCRENGAFYVELKDAVFKRGVVVVRQQVFYKPFVLFLTPGPGAEGDPCGLHSPLVASHEIHQLHKTFIQHPAQIFFQFFICLRHKSSAAAEAAFLETRNKIIYFSKNEWKEKPP
jgi:hypothetical protein